MTQMNKWVNVAIEQAMKSVMLNKYGCVIIHRNKIISTGYNYDTLIHTDKRSCLL